MFYPENSFRYCNGAFPVIALNVLLKYEILSKPHSKQISFTGFGVALNKRQA